MDELREFAERGRAAQAAVNEILASVGGPMNEPEQWGAMVSARWIHAPRSTGCGASAMDEEARELEPGTPCIMLRIRYPIFGGGYNHYWLCQQCGAAGSWSDLKDQEYVSLGYAVSTIAGLVESEEPPDAGHRFRFTVQSSGVYGMRDSDEENGGFTDLEWWGQLRIIEVRAFDLRAALTKVATDVPFGTWVEDGHG